MPSKRKKLPVWTVRLHSRGVCWMLRDEEGMYLDHDSLKNALVGRLEHVVYLYADGKPVSIRIYGKNGRIQEERTYPRKADPKRSKG